MISMFAFIIGLSGIIIGKLCFKKWFNHVSIYSALWGFTIFLYDAHLISYYYMESETWVIIFGSWCLFIIGSVTVVFAKWTNPDRSITGTPSPRQFVSAVDEEYERKVMEWMLWIMIIISLIAALHTWYILVQMFGSVTNVILRGAFLYTIRVADGIKGTVPYFKFLCLPATLFAGVYTAKVGKIKFVAILPVLICIIVDLSSMGRAMMIMAAILFTNGYFLTRRNTENIRSMQSVFSVKKIMMFSVAILLLFAGSELVRSTRHVNENLVGAKRSLKQLEGASFITPSIYLYLTGNYAVLNQYLKDDEVEKFTGANTFAPFFRLLAKFGFDTDVESYQKFFKTPVNANTGTYLRELHSDFGVTGFIVGPYIIGLITSLSWFRYRRTGAYVDLVVLSYLQVLVAMSLFYLVTIAGYLLVYLIIGLCVAIAMDYLIRNERRRRGPSGKAEIHG